MTTLMLALAVASTLCALGCARQNDHAPVAKPDATEPRAHTNRLAQETSPYLLQHAHNPVDWYPWGPEAFEKARKEDKPIFLSVGYSTCHWCHVMAHESFEDESVAAILNEHFVAIKVDREELPDVDEQYMLATQVFTQRGGWPNSVWLTPDLKPWFAGTYFPKEDHGGRPGFKTLLLKLADTWKNQRAQVLEQAQSFVKAIREVGGGKHAPRPLEPALVDQAVRAFRDAFDARHGGFGGAPKFPPHSALTLLVHQQSRTRDLTLLDLISQTLDAMAAGGFYDHVGGGFHRYSTDARWFLPHFEKMLYDNAQLIGAYTDGHRLTDYDEYRRVVAETFAWLQREMTDPAGGFYSALDADSEGEEGKFYVWPYAELIQVLGETDGARFAKIYNATPDGNFREEATGEPTGTNILHLTRPLASHAEELKIDEARLIETLTQQRARLLAEREKRVRPHLDDKVLASWNGLMIGALARAGAHFKQPAYVDAAKKAADFILRSMRTESGNLLRSWRRGEARLPAYLDDYAFFAEGLLDLHAATGEKRWLEEARKLVEIMVRDFGDAEDGGFFMTAEYHDELLMRSKGFSGGGNLPSGNGVAARVLLRLAEIDKRAEPAQRAARTLQAASGRMWASPHSAETLIVAAGEMFQGFEDGTLPARDKVLGETSEKTDADASARTHPVTVEAYASRDAVQPGAAFDVAVRITPDFTWHVYAHEPGAPNLIPTEISIDPASPFTAGTINYPKGKPVNDPVLKQTLMMYEGPTLLRVPVMAKTDAPAGDAELTLIVRTQACDDKVCLGEERHRLKIKIRIDPNAAGDPRHADVFKSLGSRP